VYLDIQDSDWEPPQQLQGQTDYPSLGGLAAVFLTVSGYFAVAIQRVKGKAIIGVLEYPFIYLNLFFAKASVHTYEAAAFLADAWEKAQELFSWDGMRARISNVSWDLGSILANASYWVRLMLAETFYVNSDYAADWETLADNVLYLRFPNVWAAWRIPDLFIDGVIAQVWLPWRSFVTETVANIQNWWVNNNPLRYQFLADPGGWMHDRLGEASAWLRELVGDAAGTLRNTLADLLGLPYEWWHDPMGYIIAAIRDRLLNSPWPSQSAIWGLAEKFARWLVEGVYG